MVFFAARLCFGGGDEHEIFLASSKRDHIVVRISGQGLHRMLIKQRNAVFVNRHPQHTGLFIHLQEGRGGFKKLRKNKILTDDDVQIQQIGLVVDFAKCCQKYQSRLNNKVDSDCQHLLKN